MMLAQVLASQHILEVFVHTNEEHDPERFAELCRRRVQSHAQNAYWMLFEPEELVRRAGQGVRQGADDTGPLVSA
jgi:riboflavin synthase